MGDLALSLVTGTVLGDSNLDDSTKLRVLQELVDMTTRTDRGAGTRYRVGPRRALRPHGRRLPRDGRPQDGVLFAAASHSAVGAIIGGGTEEQIEALRAYGMSTGLAFQIQDDLLNLIGTKEAAKKDFRSDITEGKRTMIAVHALANTTGAVHDELLEILSTKETDPARLERAVDIMQEAGSIDYARSRALELAHEHQQDLEARASRKSVP